MRRILLAAAMLLPLAEPVLAEGYLATRPTELEELVLGNDDIGYGVSQTSYDLETGKSYSLAIRSTGRKECAWEAPEFFNFVWLRKIESGDIEIKATHLYELEFENEGEAEIFFVPIRPGEYVWRCRGLEDKGMTGRFVVK